MAGKRKKKRAKSGTGSHSVPLPFTRGQFLLWSCITLIMLMLYLWGKVEIDFNVRNADTLNGRIQRLQREVNALQVEVNAKRRYQRIVNLAQAQGLVFIKPGHISVLVVDIDEREPAGKTDDRPVRYAGMITGSIGRTGQNRE